MSELNILALGDVVGRPGRRAVRELVPSLRRERGIAFVVANGENSAGGAGITLETARELLDSGVDCVTTGDHFFDKKEIDELIRFFDLDEDEAEPKVLRPANWSRHAPGKGYGVFEAAGGVKVGVLNLIGRVFMKPYDSPFDRADELLEGLRFETDVVLLDFHAEATSEKIALGLYLDGRVSALFGTHTHVQTADAKVLPEGTAYITDLGMSGPHESILGREIEPVLRRLRAGTPAKFGVGKGDVRLQGVIVTIDTESGRASGIERLDVALE